MDRHPEPVDPLPAVVMFCAVTWGWWNALGAAVLAFLAYDFLFVAPHFTFSIQRASRVARTADLPGRRRRDQQPRRPRARASGAGQPPGPDGDAALRPEPCPDQRRSAGRSAGRRRAARRRVQARRRRDRPYRRRRPTPAARRGRKGRGRARHRAGRPGLRAAGRPRPRRPMDRAQGAWRASTSSGRELPAAQRRPPDRDAAAGRTLGWLRRRRDAPAGDDRGSARRRSRAGDAARGGESGRGAPTGPTSYERPCSPPSRTISERRWRRSRRRRRACSSRTSPGARRTANGFAEAIVRESDRLNRLVGNLLDMSRIEGGALRPQRDWYDVGELVREVVGRLRKVSERTSGRAAYRGRPAAYLAGLSDDRPGRHEPDRERREVHAARHARSTSAWSGLATGSGSPSSITVRVSRPASGRPCSTSSTGSNSVRAIQGSGLGLAVSKGLVEGHDGRIWIEETPGGGATFLFELPLGASVAPGQPASMAGEPTSVGRPA